MQNGFSARRASNRQPRVECLEFRRLLSATTIVNESFEDGVADQFDLVWSNAQSSGVVTENLSNSNKLFETTYTVDESQTVLWSSVGAVDSIDVSFDVRFPDGIPVRDIARQSGSVKLSRLNAPEGAPRYHSMQNHLQFWVEPSGEVRYEIGWYVEQGGFSDDIQVEIDSSKWINIRYYAKYNTLGKNDGIWRVWIDGELRVNRIDVVFAADIAFRPDSFWIGGNISFGGDNPSRPFRRQLDNVQVIVDGEDPGSAVPGPKTGTRIEDRDGLAVLVVLGTQGNDTIDLVSQAGGDVQLRQNLVDAVFAQVDEVEIFSSDGDDLISVNSAIPVRISAAAGNDTIISSGSEVLVEAGDGNDVIFSTSSIGALFAGAGRDSIFAYGGSQILVGGDGADVLFSYTTKSPHLVVGGNIDVEPILALELSRHLSVLAAKLQVLKDLVSPLDDRTKDSVLSLGMIPSIDFPEAGDFNYRRHRR